jgi:uncharacterized tellurite resistance protein B-like protein
MRHEPISAPISDPITEDDARDLTAIAFIFLACGELTDHELATEEMGAIVSRIYTWLPIGDEAAVERALRCAVKEYELLGDSASRLKRLGEHARLLHVRLDHDQRTRVITDLISIAEADGRVLPEERSFIRAAAQTFEIELEITETRA